MNQQRKSKKKGNKQVKIGVCRLYRFSFSVLDTTPAVTSLCFESAAHGHALPWRCAVVHLVGFYRACFKIPFAHFFYNIILLLLLTAAAAIAVLPSAQGNTQP